MFENPIDMIGDIIGRVERLEQTRHGNWVTVDGTDVPVFPGGFAIGPDDEFIFTDVAPPTSVTATSGTFFEVAYILVDWDAPVTTDQVVGYRVHLYKAGQGIARTIETGGTNARFEPVEPLTNYTVTVEALNKFRKPSVPVTATPDPIITEADDTIPAAPTGVVASSNTTARSVQVRWTENTEPDVKGGAGLYEWEISTSDTVDGNGNFTVSPRRDRNAGTIILAVDLVGSTTYYAHVRAIDSSNNFSPWSSIVSATPGLLSDLDIGTLNGNHINVNSLHGNTLQANTVSATSITTSNLDAAIVTITSGGMIRMGRTVAPFHYAVEDTNGIRFYTNGTAAFTGGTLVTDLNVATGSAFFGGTLAAGVSITSPVISGGSLTTQNATFGATPSIAWSVSGTWGIINNEAYNTNALTPDGTYIAIIDSGSSDGLWSLRVRTSPTANRTQCGIIFRYVDDNNYWLAEIRDRSGAGNNGIYLWKRMTGTWNLEASWTTGVNISENTEQLIRVFTQGDYFHLYLGGTHYRTAVDSAHMTATKGGMYISKGTNLDDGGTRFLEFTRQSLSDNFNRPNAATLGSNTTDAKVFVDGTGFAAQNPTGGEAFRIYSGSGDISSKGLFATDILHASVINTDAILLKQIGSRETSNKIIIGSPFEMNNNEINLTIANSDNYLIYNNAQGGPDLSGQSRFRIIGVGADIGIKGDGGELHVMGSNFSSYRGITASAYNAPPSDPKYKKNEKKIVGALDVIEKAPGYKYELIDKFRDPKHPHKLGLMVPDLPEDAINISNVNGEEIPGPELYSLITYLWAGVRELNSKVKLLENK